MDESTDTQNQKPSNKELYYQLSEYALLAGEALEDLARICNDLHETLYQLSKDE